MSFRPPFTPTFNRGLGRAWLAGGYLFLYLPIVALILYSFSASDLPNTWSGFTFKWYAALAYIRANRLNRTVLEGEHGGRGDRFGIIASAGRT